MNVSSFKFKMLIFAFIITGISYYSQGALQNGGNDNKLIQINGTYGKPRILTCNDEPSYHFSPNHVVKWWKDDVPLIIRSNIYDAEKNTLTIKSLDSKYAGKYGCSISNIQDSGEIIAKNTFAVYIPPYAWIQKDNEDQAFTEGSKLILTCNVIGYPTPIVHWKFEDREIYTNITTGRFHFSSHSEIPNTRLVIEESDKKDRGTYKCYAKSEIGTSDTVNMVVRVRDKYKALWPFLGICIEVVILLAVINFYEHKHREQEEIDDEDNDDDLTNASSQQMTSSEGTAI